LFLNFIRQLADRQNDGYNYCHSELHPEDDSPLDYDSESKTDSVRQTADLSE